MEFRDFLRDPSKVAEEMIESPGERWRKGFGIAKLEEELAAVLHYARLRFPKGGKSLTIHPPHNETLVYKELMAAAEQMERDGLLVIDREANGHTYIGEPGHVREAMRLTMRRKPGLLGDEEQHAAVGRLLGYDEEAIEEFLKRMREKHRLRDSL